MNKLIKLFMVMGVLVTSVTLFAAKADDKATRSGDKIDEISSNEKSPLVLYHAQEILNKGDKEFKMSWHQSHRSHYSHQSHRSHYSHYSSR
jgi:hypothetical protein|tara:strand:- start:216 stop:488 length:273 start_codon:yes stop_codon:yes gene_type:complete